MSMAYTRPRITYRIFNIDEEPLREAPVAVWTTWRLTSIKRCLYHIWYVLPSRGRYDTALLVSLRSSFAGKSSHCS